MAGTPDPTSTQWELPRPALEALQAATSRGTPEGLHTAMAALEAALGARQAWLQHREHGEWRVEHGRGTPPNPPSDYAEGVDSTWTTPDGHHLVLVPIPYFSSARLIISCHRPWSPMRRAATNECAHWIGMCIRLIRAKQAEREADERYQAFLQAGFEGLCLHRDGVLLEVNQALADIYGYTREEMLGMHVRDLAAPELVPKIGRIIEQGSTEAYETAAICKDGTVIPLEARGKNSQFMGESVRVAAFRDLRPRKEAEAALVHAREAAENASASKTEFLGSMSHELRTPMQGVLGLAHLVLQTDLTPSQRHQLETLEHSAKSLLSLLNDLLDVTRIEEQRLDIAREPFSLAELVNDCTGVVRAGMQARGIDLHVRLSSSLATHYSGDAARIRQVLVNLLGNAAKFTHTGTVSIVVRAHTNGLVFRVEDTGIGMTAEQLSRVFSRFSQADSSITRRYGGTGLGLTISLGLVKAMGGEMHADSTPGRGSSFEFHLPLPTVTTQEAPAIASLEPKTTGAIDVLIAEDNMINRFILRQLLESMGHQVRVVEDGQQCLDAVAAACPELILMDVQMPVLDGLNATRQLRAQGVEVPIFALTASAMEGDRTRCLEAGMDAYLSKPLQLAELRQLLAHTFGAQRDSAGS